MTDHCSRRLFVAPLAAALTLAAAPTAQAGGPGPEIGPDPKLVIARTVQPRVAYRGVPREDNPVRSQASTFPAGVFHGAIDTLVDELGEDSVLAERGTANADLLAIGSALGGGVDAAHGARSVGAAIVPLGAAGARSMGGTMRGVADTVTGALAPMIDAARAGAGSGP